MHTCIQRGILSSINAVLFSLSQPIQLGGWLAHFGVCLLFCTVVKFKFLIFFNRFCFFFQNRFGDALGEKVWESCNAVFDRLPLAGVVDQDIFCVHGGIPRPLPGSTSRIQVGTLGWFVMALILRLLQSASTASSNQPSRN